MIIFSSVRHTFIPFVPYLKLLYLIIKLFTELVRHDRRSLYENTCLFDIFGNKKLPKFEWTCIVLVHACRCCNQIKCLNVWVTWNVEVSAQVKFISFSRVFIRIFLVFLEFPWYTLTHFLRTKLFNKERSLLANKLYEEQMSSKVLENNMPQIFGFKDLLYFFDSVKSCCTHTQCHVLNTTYINFLFLFKWNVFLYIYYLN